MAFQNILAIESSCDETTAAVMHSGILRSSIVVSQLIHAKYKGVVPELAARAHQEHIIPVVDKALQQANIPLSAIEAVAVTQGPGLLGSLLVGTSFANGLAIAQNIPVVGIHHIRAHLLANFIEASRPKFPFLGLVVSGGHTQLIVAESPLSMRLIGSTRDDAVGEVFDKVARIMGFPYPGGVYIDRHAANGNPKRFPFPIAKVAGLDFSFSGVKTAFFYFIREKQQQNPKFVEEHSVDLCAGIQAALIAMLIKKVVAATEQTGLQRIVLGGGVANNRALRQQLCLLANKHGWELFIPKPAYCTDNAAMIAMAGYYKLKDKTNLCSFVTPLPRMPL